MIDTFLLHELVTASADRSPQSPALALAGNTWRYGELQAAIACFAANVCELRVGRGERVAVWLEKRFETVVACFGATAAGAVFVPINPLLKPEQVGYILRDCNVRLLVTSDERWPMLREAVAGCEDLRHVVLAPGEAADVAPFPALAAHRWQSMLAPTRRAVHRVIDTDMAAILYTSGSTGRPKGVVLSHRNMVAGAKSVASYLQNHAGDALLAALPLSFDAGFSQLTTAFHVGARVVLINYLLPKDVQNAVIGDRVTGLTAVPPLWIQLAQLAWPETVTDHLRYFANTGGRMPRETLAALRRHFPRTRPYLMYGLTEAFRSTFLPPEEVDRRPDSIGKAIPNAEIVVLRDDGTPCAPNEPGELVHRGALVGLGYWNDPEKTAERYKPMPGREKGLVLPEIAVFSGDTVRMDDEGFLYFVGRRDEMIKTSGYRVSPTEIEEVLYASDIVAECAAFGLPHAVLGEAICAVVSVAQHAHADREALLAHCRERLPLYMVPAEIDFRHEALPRNANGKIDRKRLAGELARSARRSSS
jgi:acyl-CoA ligase (AMP-forming) (exosortase A-associated)